MSLNCVDVTIDLANRLSVPIMLIASRRQIDSEDFGGGYVNNWTTEKFSKYVRARDENRQIILARDHGGPWQNNKEVEQKMRLTSAMESAKLSLKRDIEAGFDMLHLDPSIDIWATPPNDEVLKRLEELYEYSWLLAKSKRRDIIFEVGTEEQSGTTNTPEELDITLTKIVEFCDKRQFPKPSFVVIQSGTKVMELRNVGSFDQPLRVAGELAAEIQVPKMIEVCKKHQLMMKAHNTDYLSDDSLEWHPRLGIHAVNVAPEFGVAETKALVDVLEQNGLSSYSDKFLEISYESGKWKKWMIKNSDASDRERAMISGHYIFSVSEFVELKKRISFALRKKNINIDDYLKSQIKLSIMRYIKKFRLIGDT